LVPLAVIAAFSGAGATLKLADDLGESRQSRQAYGVAILSGILLGLLFEAGRDESSYVAGIVLGVVLGRKVDRPNLVVGVLTIGITGLMLVLAQRLLAPIPWLVAVVTGLALLDELAHDRLSGRGGLSGTLTRLRPGLKVATVIMALAGLVSVPAAAGFLCFDLCYEAASFFINGSRGTDESAR
jgi:hypothetical protein